MNLTHRIYPSFITRMSVTYFSLNIQSSSVNEDLLSIYKDVSSADHGGRYTIIYNVPVHASTNGALSDEADEAGINIANSAKITVNMDSLINLIPKTSDLLVFNTPVGSYFGTYRIVNTESSSTVFNPYTRLSLELIPNATLESLKRFAIEERAFLTNYHRIFKRGECLMIIELQKKVDAYVNYFNSIYNSKIDAHVDSDHRVFLEFEKALNHLFERYKDHTNMLRIDRSFLCDNLLSYYNDSNIFTNMLDPSGTMLDPSTNKIMYTSRIKRLDKTRRRMINNRVKVYRLLDPSNPNDALLLDNNLLIAHELDQSQISSFADSWRMIIRDDFINNVKERMTTFLANDCIINEKNMFSNAIRLSQVFYLLDRIIRSAIEGYPNRTNPMGIVEHGANG